MLHSQSRQCLFLSSHFLRQESTGKLSVLSVWSEWRDLNSRPYGPEPYALPNCATPRYILLVFTYRPLFDALSLCLVARAFRQVLRFRYKVAIDIGWTSNIFVCGQVLSQTKLRYTPSVNLIAYAIYINLQIFATKLRQLSKKLYLDCVFLAEVDKIVCKMRIV